MHDFLILFVHEIVAIVIIILFALTDFLLSIYTWPAGLLWGEINARPLDYSLGVELGLLAAEVTFCFVGMVVSSSIISFMFLDFLLSIDPRSTWLLQSQIWNAARSRVGHCCCNTIYFLFKSIIIIEWGGQSHNTTLPGSELSCSVCGGSIIK